VEQVEETEAEQVKKEVEQEEQELIDVLDAIVATDSIEYSVAETVKLIIKKMQLVDMEVVGSEEVETAAKAKSTKQRYTEAYNEMFRNLTSRLSPCLDRYFKSLFLFQCDSNEKRFVKALRAIRDWDDRNIEKRIKEMNAILRIKGTQRLYQYVLGCNAKIVSSVFREDADEEIEIPPYSKFIAIRQF